MAMRQLASMQLESNIVSNVIAFQCIENRNVMPNQVNQLEM